MHSSICVMIIHIVAQSSRLISYTLFLILQVSCCFILLHIDIQCWISPLLLFYMHWIFLISSFLFFYSCDFFFRFFLNCNTCDLMVQASSLNFFVMHEDYLNLLQVKISFFFARYCSKLSKKCLYFFNNLFALFQKIV